MPPVIRYKRYFETEVFFAAAQDPEEDSHVRLMGMAGDGELIYGRVSVSLTISTIREKGEIESLRSYHF